MAKVRTRLLTAVFLVVLLVISTSQAAVSWDQAEAAISWGMSIKGSNRYPGKCLGFVQDAFMNAGVTGVTRYDHATQAGDAWLTHPGDRNPPRGAVVLWNGGISGWGHIAISLGNGRIIHSSNGVSECNIFFDYTIKDENGKSWQAYYRGWGYYGKDAYTQSQLPPSDLYPSGQFRLVSVGSNLNVYTNASNALYMSANRDIGSIWTAKDNSNGTVSIFSARSGLVLDVENASSQTEARVIMHGRTAATNKAQLWRMYGSPSNFYMKADCTTHVLDATTNVEGSGLITYSRHDQGNQRFRLEPVVNRAITVTGGSASPSPAEKGALVTLTATVPEGMEFVRWVSEGVEIQNPESADGATFVMPDVEVAVSAEYKMKELPTGRLEDILGAQGIFADGITETDATIWAYFDKDYSTTLFGCWLGEDISQMTYRDETYDKPHGRMYYNANKWFYPLTPGTTYNYRFFADIGGTHYVSDVYTFKTLVSLTLPVGDANNDGRLGVEDLLQIIDSILLGKEPSSRVKADTNQDTLIDLVDLAWVTDQLAK